MHRRLLVLLLLGLLGVACGCASVPGSSSDIDPVATQMAMNTKVALKKTAGPTLTAEALSTSGLEAAPTEPPVKTPSADPARRLDLLTLGPPQEADSYRLVEKVAWHGLDAQGVEVSEQVTTSIEFVREPSAMHVSISTDAEEMAEAMGMFGLQGDTVEFYMLDNSIYLWMFGGWMQMSLDALTLGFGFGEMPLDSGEMDFSGTYSVTHWLKDATYVGLESFDGQDTNHYKLDNDSFDLAALPAGMEVETVSGDLYTAAEGNYIVHMDLKLQGANLTSPLQQDEIRLSEGSLNFQSSLSAVNAGLTIELPEEVELATSPPDDVPIPEGAKQLAGANMFGASMFALLIEAPPEEMAAFYAAEMPEFGWSEVEGDESEAMFSAKYAKDDRTITVEIDGGSMLGTSIMLSSGDPSQFLPFADNL